MELLPMGSAKMSNASDFLLVGFDTSPGSDRDVLRIFAAPGLVRVDSWDRLSAALIECDLHVAVVGDPIGWADTFMVVREIRNRFPNCFVLIISSSESDRLATEAMKLGLLEYTQTDAIHTSSGHATPGSAGTEELVSSGMGRDCDAKGLKEGVYDSRFYLLLSNAGVGAFRCTTDGLVLWMNEAFRRMMGESIQSNGQSVQQSGPRITAASFTSFLKQVVQSDSVCHIDYTVEQPDEASRAFRLHARRQQLPGMDLGIEGLMEDITSQNLAQTLKFQALRAREKLSRLTLRERHVLDEVVLGSMNKSIARRFDISEKTVERHRSNVMKKLEVNSVAELVRLTNFADLPTAFVDLHTTFGDQPNAFVDLPNAGFP
jgi:DNA-binding NarL/FixJ family response regulator